MKSAEFSELPQVQSVRLISYQKAEVRPGFVNGTFFLVVSGEAPCLNMKIRLEPLIYIDCPEYWGTEVVGSLPGGLCLTAVKPYTVLMELTGVVGSKGIEVIGANQRETFLVTGGCTPI